MKTILEAYLYIVLFAIGSAFPIWINYTTEKSIDEFEKEIKEYK